MPVRQAGGPMRMPMLGISAPNAGDPRSDGFVRTMWSIFCPYFKLMSFLLLMCVFDIAFYIATLIHSCVVYKGLDGSSFLGPVTETLMRFGCKVTLVD